MPEKPQKIESISQTREDLVSKIERQINRENIRGSIHTLIDLDRKKAQNNTNQTITPQTTSNPRPDISTMPLAELIILAEDRKQKLANLNR
jgi:hypothetical protein